MNAPITKATRALVDSHGRKIKGHVYLTRGDGTGLLIADQNSRTCFYWIPAAGGGVQSVGMAVLDPESGIPFVNSVDYERKLVDLGYKADDPNTEYLFAENAQGVQSGGGVTITEQFFTQVQQPSQAQIGELLVMPQQSPNTEVNVQPGVYLNASDNSKQYWPGDSTTDLTAAIGSIGAGSHQIAWVCLDTVGGTLASQFGSIVAASNPLPSRYEFAPTDILGISINSTYKADVPVYLYHGQATPGIVELDILRNYDQRFITIPGTAGGGGSVNITPGTGLTSTPNPITGAGTISMGTSGVTPGAYTAANITVDGLGRVTAAASGTAVSASDVLYLVWRGHP